MLFAARPIIAQPAPYHRYLTLETPHFHVHVPAGLEREGRVAGAAAEKAYEQLARELKPPRGPLDLIVTDDVDYSNGFATPLPTNRIVVFATPPVENTGLRLNEDWLKLVITHELTHIFQIDRARGIWGLAQRVFGRGPGLFPNSYGPSWLIEGLAVYYESRLTEGGRLKDAEHRTLVRASAVEHRLPQLNELSSGSPIFPGGSSAYVYGSLFVDYLARTRGDSTVRRFVDAQSGGLLPQRLNHLSRNAFGISFQDAFAAWRDSVEHSVGEYTPPLPGWRELTRHGYSALDPRWLNDSTLVYSGSDGRSIGAEYLLSLNGERRRIGRRNTLGPSVPLADGSLLFAQFDYTGPSEVRSDLYIEKDGHQRRLTYDMRLIQPDVRRDSVIVATQIAAARTSLILIDPRSNERRLLREAGPDETWSEPRWSRDGTMIATIHRTHGGTFSLEVIDITTGVSRVLASGRYAIAGPSWSADDRSVVYTSEESGVPELVRASVNGGGTVQIISGTKSNGIFTPETSPSGSQMAAVGLRADGYHVGVAPAPSSETLPAGDTGPALRDAPPDSQPLAPGEYHRYSAWRSVLPRYWYPILEDAPNRGTRFGMKTSGRDVIGRHFYDAYATASTGGGFPTAAVSYRYAGLRRPFINVDLSQDYTRESNLVNGGTNDTVGTLLRRSRNAGLSMTFVRPRYRTYSQLSLGGALERRDFMTDPPQFLKQQGPAFELVYSFPSAFLAGQWSNTKRPALSVSSEDGVSLAFTARARTRADSTRERLSTSVLGTMAMFKSLDLPGFAHHVIAVRLAGGIADRRAASSLQVGGTSGGTIQIIPTYTVGEGRRTFGVRGFPAGSIFGTRAAAGALEYRLPLKLGGVGLGALPFFFDRSSITAFADAGVATCPDSPGLGPNGRPLSGVLNPTVCSPSPRIGRTIASTGAELVLSAALLDWDSPQNLRIGFAVPVAGRELVGAKTVSAYVAYGLSF